MRLTHGELRGLTALALLLVSVLLIVWLMRRQGSAVSEEDDVRVRELLEVVDSVAASGQCDTVVGHSKVKRGSNDSKARKRKPAQDRKADRRSPLESVNG